MNKTDLELESFFRYRLIQVLYIVVLIFFLFLSIVIAIVTFPQKSLDLQASYVTCSNGQTYSFSVAGVHNYSHYFWQSDTPKLLDDDRQQLKTLCINSLLTSSEEVLTQHYNQLKQTMQGRTPSTEDVLHSLNDEQLLMLIDALTIKKEMSQNTASGQKSISSVQSIKNILFIYDSSRAVWFWFVLLFFLLPTCLYAFLNILRETLIYLFIGRKFTWHWLKFYRRSRT